MELSRFLSISREFFEGFLRNESTKEKPSAKYFIENFLTNFTVNEGVPFIPVNVSIDESGKILTGKSRLSKAKASELLAHLDSETFVEFYSDCDFSEEQEQSLKTKFRSDGIVLKDVPKDMTKTLNGILEEIASTPKLASVRDVEFLPGNMVRIGNSKYKLAAGLSMPPSVGIKENGYVLALLNVYSQSEKKMIDITNIVNEPFYSTHLNLQRRDYCSALSAYRKLRDSGLFRDGEEEFFDAEEDILSTISPALVKKCHNALERVDSTLEFVVKVTYWRSYLVKDGTLIGNREKRGIIHMLVNDGKIEWIRVYDTDI